MNDIVKLAESVQQMRAAQTEYFRTRSSISLTKSKKLEKEVDDMVRSLVKPSMASQGNIFGKPIPSASADLRHEIKFCIDMEMETNEHGVFLYTSSTGAHSMSMPYILSDYRDFLIAQGIAKDFQRS